MKKIQKHIEIVRSSIISLSSLSLESSDAIYKVLSKHYESVGVSTVNSVDDLEDLILKKPDLAFMGMKYVPGAHPSQKVWLSTVLAAHGIRYTGSNQIAGEFENNKILAKQQVHNAGLKTSRYLTVKNGLQYEGTNMPLTYPLFIKPASLGGGAGIDTYSVVHNMHGLHAKVRSIGQEFTSDSLIEEFLPGREFSVAVLRDEQSDGLHVMPIELVAAGDLNGDLMLSQNVKSSNTEVVLPVIDPMVRTVVCELAIGAFKALQASDYGRFDIRMDAFGVPHFLEANLIPSLIDGYGSFPKACMLNLGLAYEDMILTIVRLGFGSDKDVITPASELVLAGV